MADSSELAVCANRPNHASFSDMNGGSNLHQDKDTDESRPPDNEKSTPPSCSTCCSPKVIAYKNVIGSSLSFMLFVAGIVALISLQSSLNSTDGLGLTSLSVSEVTFFLSALFSSSIIKILGTKYTIIASYIVSSSFIFANYYPQWYTLIPGAILFGFAFGPLFASHSVHLTTIAIRYAPQMNENPDYLIALFTGILSLCFKLSYIPGNTATTIILFTTKSQEEDIFNDTDESISGNFCNNTDADNLPATYVYILVSCFVFLCLMSIIISASLMDHLNTELKFHSFKESMQLYFKEPIVKTLLMFKDWKIYMLLPIMTTDSFISSTMTGSYSKVYISDCIGVQWIGLFVITFGTCSGLSALIAGRLAKYIPQFVFYYLSALILCCVLLFLIFWERQPSYVVAFVPPALIGICEGTFNSLPPTLVGILYHDKQEQAYSVLRMGFAVGYLMGFTFSIFLDFGQISWIIIAFILLSTLTYSVVVFIALPRRQLLPCLYIRKSTDDDDDDKDHTSSNPTTTNDTKFIVDEMELQVKLPQNGTIDS